MTSTRKFTPIDRIAEDFLEAQIAASPLTATYLGISGSDHLLDDFSMEGVRQSHALIRSTLDAVSAVEPQDDVDRVTVAALRERLGVEGETLERILNGLDPMALNVIDSPVQQISMAFDLMPAQSTQDWSNIVARLMAIPAALQQYAGALEASAQMGSVPPERQVRVVASQCVDQAGEDSGFTALTGKASDQNEQTKEDLASAIQLAQQAFAALADTLTQVILPLAPHSDAAGIDRYQVASRFFLGAQVDLAETYAWGQAELARITTLMEETADQIKPGASVKEAIAILNADERYQLHGTEALQEWMQVKADDAIRELADTHFDIPAPVRKIACQIAPSQTGAVYYTGPSEDFSRPGSMWWSVPKGVTDFTTWAELTTVYHEGVPGHHLQIAQTLYRSAELNRWRRNAAFTSGHAEGWALYAEWLMADLGYLDDPGMRMGLLDAQSLRATRVVIDIGVHCEFEAPAEVGGGEWTYDKAWTLLREHTNGEENGTRFELDRYLGWPGQAPAYKIGERLWLELRDEKRAQLGDDFDLKAFHREALDLGGLGLDTLRAAVLGQL